MPRRGEFVFFADIDSVGEEDDLSFVARASSVGVDRGRERVTEKAIESMRRQDPIPFTVGPDHRATIANALAIIGWGHPEISDDASEFILKGNFDPDYPGAKALYNSIKKYPDQFKVSVGGIVPYEARREVYDPETGQMVTELDEFILDHVFICRASAAVNQDTYIEAKSSDWREMVFKAAESWDDDMGANEELEDEELIEKAKWTVAYVNDLPDSAFLYIEPGGKKDKEGKTVPRSLRHLPVRDANGKLDEAHLRNAIARAPLIKLKDGSKIPATLAKKLQDKARKLLETLKGQKKGKAIGRYSYIDVRELVEAAFNTQMCPEGYVAYAEDTYEGVVIFRCRPESDDGGGTVYYNAVSYTISSEGDVSLRDLGKVFHQWIDEEGNVVAPPSPASANNDSTNMTTADTGKSEVQGDSMDPEKKVSLVERLCRVFLGALEGKASEEDVEAIEAEQLVDKAAEASEVSTNKLLDAVEALSEKLDDVVSLLQKPSGEDAKADSGITITASGTEELVVNAEDTEENEDSEPKEDTEDTEDTEGEKETEGVEEMKAQIDMLAEQLKVLASQRGVSVQPPLGTESTTEESSDYPHLRQIFKNVIKI